MPSFKNLKNVVGKKTIPEEYLENENNQEQQNLQDDEDRRNKGLNDLMNKGSPPPSISKYLPDQNQEDVIPYDQNAGTLINVGRFALNNLAMDKFGGGFPLAGSLKSVAPAVEGMSSVLGREAAGKAAMNLAAEEALNAAKAGQVGPTMIDVARSQNAASRAIDMADRFKNLKKRFR